MPGDIETSVIPTSSIAHSATTGRGADDHHTKYADADAVAAVVIEADWTPVIMDDSLDGTGEGQTYSVQKGLSWRFGNLVICTFELTSTSIGSLTGGNSLQIGGLPYVQVNETKQRGGGSAGESVGLALTARDSIGFRGNQNASFISVYLWRVVAGTAAMTVTQWSADGGLTGTFIYEAVS